MGRSRDMNIDPFLLPLHPAVVHFPIAMFTITWGFLAFGYIKGQPEFRRKARMFEVIGVISLPFVVATGLIDTRGIDFLVNPRWDAPLIWHVITALAGASLFAAHFFWSKNKPETGRSFFWDLGLPTLGLWVLLIAGLIAGEMIFGQ